MQSNLLPPKAPAVPAAQMSHEAQSAPLLMAKQTAAAKRPPAEQDAGKSGVDVTRASKRQRSGEWISPRDGWNLPPESMVPEGLEIRDCGYMGVRWSRKKHKWRVRIKAHGKVSSDTRCSSCLFCAFLERDWSCLHDFSPSFLALFRQALLALLTEIILTRLVRFAACAGQPRWLLLGRTVCCPCL